MKWLVLLLGLAANAAASIMIKMAVSPPYQFPSLGRLDEAIRNWPFWLGLALYGAAFLLYSAALVRLPLNVAHPIMTSGAVAAVALASILLLKESFCWTTGVGILLVLVGVIFISLGPSS